MVAKRKAYNERVLLEKYGDFSKKLTQNHHLENLSEFLLHDVCDVDLFSLPKAAYLVNNPDFVCLKGVAGYHHVESFKAGESWINQKEFADHMKKASFNQRVRGIQEPAFKFKAHDYKDHIYRIAHDLAIDSPSFHIWNLKHNNQGLLIFQQGMVEEAYQGHLEKFLYMLSFCPVF